MEKSRIDLSKLTSDQAKGLKAALSGRNCFITGGAGVGKSFLTHAIIQELEALDKKVVVAAPTGVAAANVNGVTVHKLLGITPDKTVDLNTLEVATVKSKVLETADVIIVDEISMVTLDTFDCLCKSIQRASTVKKTAKQLIVVGDFCQLPPVINSELLTKVYPFQFKHGYAFEGGGWQWANFVPVILRQVTRQSDIDFINALNYIRCGMPQGLKFILDNCAKEKQEGAIYMSARNADVNNYNDSKLAELEGKEKSYIAIKTGEEVNGALLDVLTLKKGARVMILANSKDYVNGTLATVVALPATSKISERKIKLRLDTGKVVEIPTTTTEKYSYEVVSKNGALGLKKVVVGTMEQFPIKLAYAITIHKSQGQTYEAINLNPRCWESGQMYCALSRAKDISKLYISENIKPSYVRCNDSVIDFYKEFYAKEKTIEY